MEEFLNKFSTIPKKFLSDFYFITKETYKENELVVDFDIVIKWLQVRKQHLKRLLINNFEEGFDYTIDIKNRKRQFGSTIYHQIMITPNCFRELCMLSQSKKAKEVRKYFIEMEKLVSRYHQTIKDSMYQEIGLLKQNQKSKVNINGGVLYIIKAMNTSDTLYKIGKTQNINNRIKSYNTGNANDVVPEFIIPVNDIDAAENCVKSFAKRFQYRDNREVYNVNIDILKNMIEKCVDVSKYLESLYEKDQKSTENKLDNIITNPHVIYFKKSVQ